MRLAGVISNTRAGDACFSTALNIHLSFFFFLIIYTNFAVVQNIVLNPRQWRNALRNEATREAGTDRIRIEEFLKHL